MNINAKPFESVNYMKECQYFDNLENQFISNNQYIFEVSFKDIIFYHDTRFERIKGDRFQQQIFTNKLITINE